MMPLVDLPLAKQIDMFYKVIKLLDHFFFVGYIPLDILIQCSIWSCFWYASICWNNIFFWLVNLCLETIFDVSMLQASL
jgi:hypothetical protein